MIDALHHIDIAVADLEAAAAQYEALLGRSPSWRGEAAGMRQVLFRLPNMALNLLGYSGPGVTGESLKQRLDTVGEGLWALSFAVTDINAAQRLLERRGVPTSAPTTIRATHPETGEKRYWNTCIASTAATHGVQIYLIEDAPQVDLSPAIDGDLAAVAELDHVVINTPNPDRAVALYGGRFGLDLRLDRANTAIGARQLFFKLGTAIVEFGARLGTVGEGPDRFGGLAWRVRKPDLINARLARAGFNVSEVRQGRKPGTAVFTVRDKTCAVPTIMIEQGAQTEAR